MRSVAVPWYRREDYERIRGLMHDPESLAETYDGWLMAAESNEAEARRVGIAVVRVTVEPEAFTQWCMAQGRPRDRSSRVAFVEAVMAESGSNPR